MNPSRIIRMKSFLRKLLLTMLGDNPKQVWCKHEWGAMRVLIWASRPEETIHYRICTLCNKHEVIELDAKESA